LTSPPTILLNITTGFQARMLLRTDVARHLIETGHTLIVASPNAEEPYFAREFDQPGFRLVTMPACFSPLEAFLVKVRQYLLMNPSLGATLNYKRDRFRKQYPLRAFLIRIANLFLGNIPILRRLYQFFERKIYAGREWDALLEEVRPTIVVACTPGFLPPDMHLLRASARHGIPSVTVMLSWDNLSSKGYMGAYPDHLLVWSPLMAEEARRYHDFAGPIHEVGAAQFDIYAEVDKQTARAELRARHGMGSAQRLIVWGTINQAIYPEQLDDLVWFIEQLSEIDPGAVLWVRLHPQTITGQYAHLRDAYTALDSDRVHIELPPVRSEKLAWDLPKEDMRHLAELLAAADVVVIPRSTLSIDAAAAGTPIVNVAVNPEFAKGFAYTHYAQLLTRGGVRVAGDHRELLDLVRAYLDDPDLDAEGRAAIVEQQLGSYFGRAAERTARVLAELAADR